VKILLAVDRSDYGLAAARAVVSQFAGHRHHVRLFHVTDWETHLPIALQFAQGPHAAHSVLSFENHVTRDAQQYLERLATSLRAAGFIVTIEIQPEGDAKTAILAAAAAWPADLIVMGSHGRTGLDRVLLGSVSEGVVHRAPCSVEIVRRSCAS